jgi:hypothetical protein
VARFRYEGKTRRHSPCRPCLGLTDAVDKVGEFPPMGNNRLLFANSLNRFCASGACLESILRRDPLKILFQQHRPRSDAARRIYLVQIEVQYICALRVRMSVTYDLSARTAVVTGGAKGIGRAIAQRLVVSGARVWV